MRPVRGLIADFKSIERKINELSISDIDEDEHISDEYKDLQSYEGMTRKVTNFETHWDYFKYHYETHRDIFIDTNRFHELGDLDIVIWFGEDRSKVKRKNYRLHFSFYYSRARRFAEIEQKKSTNHMELIINKEYRTAVNIMIHLYEIFIEGLKIEEETEENIQDIKLLTRSLKGFKDHVNPTATAQPGNSQLQPFISKAVEAAKSFHGMEEDDREEYLGNMFAGFLGDQGHEIGSNVSRMLGGVIDNMMNNVNLDDIGNGDISSLTEQVGNVVNNVVSNEEFSEQITGTVGQLFQNVNGEPQPGESVEGAPQPQIDISQMFQGEAMGNLIGRFNNMFGQANTTETVGVE